jgi:heat shock protein HspQ
MAAPGPSTRPVARSGTARFTIGDVVRHRLFGFRGVVFDIDPEYDNGEAWYQAIPEDVRPAKEQPFYHLFVENDEGGYNAYCSEGNLVADGVAGPVDHPALPRFFTGGFRRQRYVIDPIYRH